MWLSLNMVLNLKFHRQAVALGNIDVQCSVLFRGLICTLYLLLRYAYKLPFFVPYFSIKFYKIALVFCLER